MDKDFIKDKLKQLRLECQMTADEVGTLIGNSGKTVNGWEMEEASLMLKHF